MTTRTIKTIARILPSQSFIDEVDKTVRQISPILEVQWDGATWTDESSYLTDSKANEKLASESGEGIASTFDFELDNTSDRFTPNNISSPLYGYIKPRTNVRMSIVMGGYTYRIFTGYIKNIHPDFRTKVCSFECYDNQVFVYNKRANGVVYQNYRSDQLLAVLAELAGLTSTQYQFDIGVAIVNFGYFEDRNVWPIMGEIAVAERGRVFFDRDGILKFWNRDRLHNRHSSITLTLEDHITDLDYSIAEHEIKNKIIVQATPRASAGVQPVWSSGNAEYLNPYTDTLVFIPANNVQVATLELEDPCTTFITPIPSIDYTANSAQDGSGDDLTDDIEIHEFINYGNAVFISVLNIGAVDAYLTKFQIRGNPAKILKWIRVTATDDQSINSYGEQEYKIENNFIDSEGSAREIADEELYRRKDSINLFRVNIVGIPHLLCGDVVNVEHGQATIGETSQGPNSPETMADDSSWGNYAWSNVDNAKESDNAYATVTTIWKTASHYLKATNFSFNIPVDATINGILVEIEEKTSSGTAQESHIRIVKSDGTIGSTERGTGAFLPSTDTYISYGSSSDLWGETWTATDINDEDFGVIFSAGGIASFGVDHIRITVYHTGAVGTYREFMISEMNWSFDDGGFKQKITLVNPYIFPIKVFISARGNIVKALKTVSSKAKLTGAKYILAKASIELETSRAVTSKGKITG